MVPRVALWIHELALVKHTSFFGTLLDASSLAPVAQEMVRLVVFFFPRHGRVHLHFQLSHCIPK